MSCRGKRGRKRLGVLGNIDRGLGQAWLSALLQHSEPQVGSGHFVTAPSTAQVVERLLPTIRARAFAGLVSRGFRTRGSNGSIHMFWKRCG